jgi:preprotein translocase subunit SecB
MKENEQPGIKFERVFLGKLVFELPKVKPENFKYDPLFNYSYTMSKKKLIATLSIILYDGFSLDVVGIFSTIKGKENMLLEKFAKTNAPALLIPYAREIINDITSKSPLPTLIMPPINVIALLKKKKSIKSSTSSSSTL